MAQQFLEDLKAIAKSGPPAKVAKFKDRPSEPRLIFGNSVFRQPFGRSTTFCATRPSTSAIAQALAAAIA